MTATPAEVSAVGQESLDHPVALTYARAFLGAADKSGNAAEVLAELDSFTSEVFTKLPQLAAVFASGLVSSDEKAALVTKAIAGRGSATFTNFLHVLANHGRLDLLPEVQRAAHKLLDEQRGIKRVKAITAEPLDPQQITDLEKSLGGLLGGEPRIENHVDPQIIGGLILQVGDRVYDASITSQLEKVREQMIARSVHEIQSRRDRFSSPEGN
jgi:F-type H+-transporting ATPase subunit delta